MRSNSEISRFCQSERGTVAIFWGVSLVVFLALIALIFDIGRAGITQSELQSFADNVALAAAGELDGNPDALTRANAAAANLIEDRHSFGTSSGGNVLKGVGDYDLWFHETLPINDTAPLLAADRTTDPAVSAFAEVVVKPRAVQMVFLRAVNAILGNGSPIPSINATAVAGFTQEACDITPLMFCLPGPGYTALGNVGNQILLRSGGQGAAWGPGDFGFLDPTKSDLGATCQGQNGANLLRCLVGAELAITQCFTQRGVDIEPGQKVGIEDAMFNVRFDMYNSSMSQKKTDPDYPPAPNVISGVMPAGGGSCIGQNGGPTSNTRALPKDACIAAGTCRYGSGNWDYDGYIDKNHGDDDGFNVGEDTHLTSHTIAGGQYAGTRYELYNQEILHGNSNLAGGYDILTNRDETGRAQCFQSAPSARPERRVVIAAGIDCIGNSINGAATNVPVEEFFEMFLTEPVGTSPQVTTPPTLDLLVEIIGSAGGDGYSSAGAGGIFRDVVQLYR